MKGTVEPSRGERVITHSRSIIRSIAAAVAAAMVATLLVGAAPATAGAVSNSIQQVYTAGTATTPSQPVVGYTGDLLELQAADIGTTAAEPTIGVDLDGVPFFAGSTLNIDRSQVWGVTSTDTRRSLDGGLTWDSVQNRIPALEASAPPGNADPFVYVDPATGRVFNIDLLGACSWLNYSDDKGESWEVSPLACGMPVNDHQTIGSGVPRNGLQTTNYPNVLYYCANQVFQTGCGRSTDGGLIWTPVAAALPTVGTEGTLCGALTGHLETDPEGRVFLPSRQCGKPYIAISDDNGDSWHGVVVSNLPSTATHTAVAADSAGNLYFVWFSGVGNPVQELPFLAISTDHGETWSDPMMIAPPGVAHTNFPVIAALGEGKIAINFPGTTDQATGLAAWNQYVVVSDNALDAQPVFLSATANDPADPIHRGACRGRCGGLWDFLDIVISPSGQAWAAASDDCITACVTQQQVVAQHIGRGIAIRQIGGPSLTD